MAFDSLDPVCEFYTSHPYPPPVANLDRARDEWKDENRHRAEYHLLWPDQPYRADLEILIAGCGTWQAAKYALCRPDARVVGIDVSTTSLEHTEQLKRQYGLANLEIRQLPIEEVDALEQRFDLIVCTGVLHHLADPDRGLRALRSALRPEGAVHLMVYGTYGRTGIYMLQDYCRMLGIGTSAQEIDDLVAVLETLPPRHPLTALLNEARDFRNADALADALLNPRDRSYSVPQLLELIDRSDLTFGRWYLQAPYLPQCGAIAATPHASRLAARSDRDQYAAVELWRGTIARHGVVAYRSDASEPGAKVRFDDQRWRRYVPIRRPASICVKERLPAGAAGVLLNRSHAPHHDLILVIDAEEKQMVDAIDGRRTIADIVDHVRSTAEHADHAEKNRSASSESSTVDPFGARVLFEKLWRYDQVVFDASRAAGTDIAPQQSAR